MNTEADDADLIHWLAAYALILWLVAVATAFLVQPYVVTILGGCFDLLRP